MGPPCGGVGPPCEGPAGGCGRGLFRGGGVCRGGLFVCARGPAGFFVLFPWSRFSPRSLARVRLPRSSGSGGFSLSFSSFFRSPRCSGAGQASLSPGGLGWVGGCRGSCQVWVRAFVPGCCAFGLGVGGCVRGWVGGFLCVCRLLPLLFPLFGGGLAVPLARPPCPCPGCEVGLRVASLSSPCGFALLAVGLASFAGWLCVVLRFPPVL